MKRHARAFAAGSLAQGRRALVAVGREFSGRRDPAQQVHETFLDTFDDLVHASGHTFSATGEQPAILLCLRRSDGALVHRLLVESPPAFVADLPRSPLRDDLAPVVGCRRLFPVLRLALRRTVVRVEDEHGKAVARVVLEHGTAADPEGESRTRRMRPAFEVQGLRGYEGVAKSIAGYLAEELGLSALAEGRFERGLAVIGRVPGGRGSKLVPTLDPAEPAAAAMAAVLQSLLDTLRRNVDGVRRDLDPEFLHDLRVAVRRTRSALGQIKRIFPADDVRRYRDEFAWLGRETNLLRDLDVYLLELPGYRAELTESARPALDRIESVLRGRREAEQRRLAAVLDGERFGALVAGWQAFLADRLSRTRRSPRRAAAPSEAPADTPNAGRPIREVAARRVGRAHRRVIECGRAIDDASPAEDLHRLRIECKKLRYLLEFFAGIFDGPAVARCVKALKQLQDNLGALNDLAVQRGKLTELLRDADGQASETALDAGALAPLFERFDQRRRDERERFARCFAGFDDPRVERRFERLLRDAPGEPR